MSIQNIRISYRLLVIVATMLAGMLVGSVIAFSKLHDSLIEDRKIKTQNLVETVYTLLQHYAKLEAEGMPGEEARKQAMTAVKALRYGKDDYFWINDMRPVMVMHPFKPQLDGKDLSGVKDANGKKLFVEFVNTVKAGNGEGFINYMWPKPGVDEPIQKLSFVKQFKPWGWIVGSGIYLDDVERIFFHQLMMIGLVCTGILVFALGVYWVVAHSITAPLGRIADNMRKLSNGDTDIEVEFDNCGSEIGLLSKSMVVFKENAIKNKQMAAQIEREREAAEEEKQRAIRAFSEEISRLTSAAAAGDLSARLSLEGKEGELRTVSEELNRLVATMESGLDETVAMLSALSRGDLTQRMVKEYQGAFLRLKNDSNATAEQLGKIVGEISQASERVQSATSEIAEGTRELASRTEQQASSLEETAAAMEQLTETVRQNATNAAQANQLSSSARETAEKGGDVVSDAVSAMSRIEEASQKITEIVSLIEEIAFQTNLLALNAAVEAARAGEVGSGFAVVASEVRALAQRSSNASREIKDLIDASSRQVGEGVKLVNHTGETLSEIVTSIKSVADIVSEIASASQEQSTGLNEINTAIASMDEMTQKNAALVEETTTAAQSMHNQTTNLSSQVAFFNTGKTAAQKVRAATIESAA